MRKYIETPRRILITIGIITFFTELLFMMSSEKFASIFDLTQKSAEILDATLITTIVTLLIYFVVIRKMYEDERKINRTNESLLVSKVAVERSKVETDALLASISEGIVATDNFGIVTAINHKAEDILGWKAEEIIGKKFVDVVPAISKEGEKIKKGDRLISNTLKCFATGEQISSHSHPLSRAMFYVKKNRRKVPVKVSLSPIVLNNEVIGMVEIFYDTTKEDDFEKTKGYLLTLASHQLRTPLSGTKWLIETLIKGLHGPLTKEQGEYLNEIYKINERMTTLVHDMLDVLRIENGAIAVKNDPVSTSIVMDTLVKNSEQIVREKNLTIHIKSGTESIVKTDFTLLQNILDCIISNAINYSNINGVISVGFDRKKNDVIFFIEDSGIGIPKKEQGKIFDRFYRASNAKTFYTKGSGLGLYIATLLADKLGVKITFKSTEGKGSIFYVHVPIGVAEK